MNLLTVIPYHTGDYDAAKRLLSWITTLGGCKPHACLLVADDTVPKEHRVSLKALAEPSFDFVASMPLTIPKVGYAPNHMFMLGAKGIQSAFKLPWLWLEPDAVPLKPGWLDALADAYEASPKRFLGSLIPCDKPGLPPMHLSGVSIYPPDAFEIYDKFASIKTENVTWDMEAAHDIVPRAANTPLMQHFWGKRDLPPTFVHERTESSPENALTLSFIKPESALFHRSKDGTLIELLRKQPAPPTSQILTITHPLAQSPVPAPRRGRPPKQQPALATA